MIYLSEIKTLDRWIDTAGDSLQGNILDGRPDEFDRIVALRKAFWHAREILERPNDYRASFIKTIEEVILTKALDSPKREAVLMALKKVREALP